MVDPLKFVGKSPFKMKHKGFKMKSQATQNLLMHKSKHARTTSAATYTRDNLDPGSPLGTEKARRPLLGDHPRVSRSRLLM